MSQKIYHYTGVDGLIGLLSGTLWCTHINFLNDKNEYTIINRMRTEFKESAIRDRRIAKKILFNDIKNFVETTIDLSGTVINNINAFISSFTTDFDSTKHWLSYGNGENRYSLGFNLDKLKKSLLTLNPDVLDIASNIDLQIKDVRYSDVCKVPNVFDLDKETVIDIASQKTTDWNHENEYRIILVERNSVFKQKFAENIKWRSSKGIAIPYIPLKFDPNVIENVICLSQNSSERIEDSLNMMKQYYALKFNVYRSQCGVVL